MKKGIVLLPIILLSAASASAAPEDHGAALLQLVTLIDRAPKLLAIQDLKVRVVNITQPKELLATLTLSGYILTGKLRT